MTGIAGRTAPWRIGVDVGGTYTDLVLADWAGAVTVVKVPSVPDDPSEGVLRACAAVGAQLGLSLGDLLAGCTLFIHGTTVATNTLLTRTGARVGLLTTEGFRDWLAIRRGMRANPWAHRVPNPEPLVARRWRIGIPGRLDASGAELAPLDQAAVGRACDQFRSDRIEAVAICLMHAHASSAHEDQVADWVRTALPGLPVTCSGALAPVVGEYARGATAVMNAYLAPRVSAYLTATERRLAAAGLTVPLLLVQSNGGAAPVAAVADQPVRLLLSGPAAGVGALARLARLLDQPDLISIEIGGTSCDVILLADGRTEVFDHHEIDGHHLAVPTVDIHTVGAGGGTMARVDGSGDGALLAAGPAGAGARPGPAAYGFGGDKPTVTDAALVLGRLRPGPQGSGGVSLDLGRAGDVIDRVLARPLGLSVERAAAGVIAVVEQNLVHAVERLSVERGRDPRRFGLVAAGGAGPMHGTAVARRLRMARVLLPRLAGAFCAQGLLEADIRRDVGRARLLPLDRIGEAGAEMAALSAEALGQLAACGFEGRGIDVERWVDLRYRGQQWDVRVAAEEALDPALLRTRFEADYDRLFGHIQPGGQIDLTGLRVTGVGRLAAASTPAPVSEEARPPVGEVQRVWLAEAGGFADVPVYQGADLYPGHLLHGPLIIEEATTTLFIDGPDHVAIHAAGCVVVDLGNAS